MSSKLALARNDGDRLVLRTSNKGLSSNSQESHVEYKIFVEPPQLSATITDLCNEPLFCSTYLSDEEDFSASEEDSMSVSSGTTSSHREDDFADDVNAAFAELQMEERTIINQQCNRAQAVQLVAAGRPKIIQVAKVYHSMPVLKRSSNMAGRFHIASKSLQLPIASQQHNRGVSRKPSGYGVDNIPELPSTPVLEQGVQTPVSVHTPLTPMAPNAAYRFPLDNRTPKSNQARVREQFSVKPLNIIKRKPSITPMVPPYTITLTGPPSAPLSAPPTYAYSKPKMSPRSPSEPGTSIEIPPFADEPIAPIKPARPWLGLTKDSFGSLHQRETSSTYTRPRVRKMSSVVGLNKR
ncbi:hypothetical protein BDV97DRAFT_401462 [Delphinella strobiligena]|nr:hypothetical protein BDV97DRAFT_401462 [Delphinella strobiligena]